MVRRLPIVGAAPMPKAAASAWGAFELDAKQRLLQLERLTRWRVFPKDYPSPARWTGEAPLAVHAEVRVPVGRDDAAADPRLEDGKRHNVALAAKAFQGVALRPGRPFSFWRTLGRATAKRGFRPGLAISGGCLTPAIGGGLCLVSNALFEVALRAGFHILERHGHTQEAVPTPAGALWGLDATVFWPYVDLRFAPRQAPAMLEVVLDGDTLRVSVRAEAPADVLVELALESERTIRAQDALWRENRVRRVMRPAEGGAVVADEVVAENRRRVLTETERARTCLTCGETSCHRRAAHGITL